MISAHRVGEKQIHYTVCMLYIALALTIMFSSPGAQPAESGSPATATPMTTQPSALSRFPLAAQEKIKRRAQCVYEFPDGAIFDAFYAVEFRNVLDEYDGRKAGSSVPGRALAWGFTEKNRYPSTNRSNPLWHTTAERKPGRTAFLYVNSALDTRREIARGRQFTLNKEVAENLFTFTYHQFPGSDSNDMRMPNSVVPTYAAGVVRIERDQQPKTGTPRTGEFFVLLDAETTEAVKKIKGIGAGLMGYRIVQARDLRLDAERYAKALLDGRAELIEWSFKKTSGRLGDTYTWTSTTMPVPEREGAQADTNR